MYDVGPYFISKFIVELPILIFWPLIFGALVYFGVGLEATAE